MKIVVMTISYNIHYFWSEGVSLRDMLSLGAWRMGLGYSGKFFRRRRRRPRPLLLR